jgi:hypothetical protein
VNERAQFLNYVLKVFNLNRGVRGVRDSRPYGQIPPRPLFLSLLLGIVLRVGSYNDLAQQTPVAMVAQMLILMLGFVLFSAYAILHSQQIRRGQVCPKELAHHLDLVLEEDWPWDLWFACG